MSKKIWEKNLGIILKSIVNIIINTVRKYELFCTNPPTSKVQDNHLAKNIVFFKLLINNNIHFFNLHW